MIEKVHIALKTLLIEIWTLKIVLVRSQMEIMNMLLDAGGKTTLSTVSENLIKLWCIVLFCFVFNRFYKG